MNIAVCVSGQLRNFKETFPYFKENIINHLNPDVFIYGDGLSDELIELYEPKGFGYQKDLIDYDYSGHIVEGGVRPTGIINMYYKIKMCNELKKNYELQNQFKYDLVIRARFDEFFIRKFNQEELQIPSKTILMPWGWDFKSVSPYSEADILALGYSEDMDVYSSVFDNFDEYKRIIPFHPETLCGYNLHVNGIKVKTYLINAQFHYPDIDPLGLPISLEDRILELKAEGVDYVSSYWDGKILYHPIKY